MFPAPRTIGLMLLSLFITAFALVSPVLAQQPDAAAESAAAPEATAAETPVTAGWNKGFFLQDNNGTNKLKISARVQSRYTYEAPEEADYETQFSIPRARLSLSGTTLTKGLGYKMQVDFGKGFVALKDFYVDFKLVVHWVSVRFGQYKRPFSRQQLTSSSTFEFVDRAITDKAFGSGRDLGLMLHNNFSKSPTIEYAIGVFNGTGDKGRFSGDVAVDAVSLEGEVDGGGFSNVPDRMHPMVVARVGYNYGGIKGYSEADLEGGPLRFAVGGSALADLDSDENNDGAVRGELDFILKIAGFSASAAVYAAWAQDGAAFADQTFAALGYHAQLGYLVTDNLQPVLRYALVNPDGNNNDTQEVGGGLAVYFFGHKLKLLTDVLALVPQEDGQDPTDWMIRSQLQLTI